MYGVTNAEPELGEAAFDLELSDAVVPVECRHTIGICNRTHRIWSLSTFKVVKIIEQLLKVLKQMI